MSETTVAIVRREPGTDLRRYQRVMAGESVEEIAAADGVTLLHVQNSVAQGQRVLDAQTARTLADLRAAAAIDNEKLRARIRKSMGKEMEEALKQVLTGKKVALEVDKETGKVNIIEYVDPDVMVRGIEQYRKTVSLEERPAPVTLIQNNVQQNSATIAGGGGEQFDFEAAILEIRREQAKMAHEPAAIDTEYTATPEPAEKAEDWSDI